MIKCQHVRDVSPTPLTRNHRDRTRPGPPGSSCSTLFGRCSPISTPS